MRDRHAGGGEVAEVQSGGAMKDTRAGSGDEDESGGCNGIAGVIHELCMNGMWPVGVVYRVGRKQEDVGRQGSVAMNVETLPTAGTSGTGRRDRLIGLDSGF